MNLVAGHKPDTKRSTLIPLGCPAARLFSLINGATATALHPWQAPRRLMASRREMAVARKAIAISSPSQAMADFFKSQVPKKAIEIIPNAVSTDQWRVSINEPNLTASSESANLFFAGKVNRMKGIEELHQAVEWLEHRA